MATNEAIAHFKTKNSDIVEYLYCYLKTFKYRSMVSTSSIATAFNSKIVKAMPFKIPDEELLKKFNKGAKIIFKMIKANQFEMNSLNNLKDTLLPKLMLENSDSSTAKLSFSVHFIIYLMQIKSMNFSGNLCYFFCFLMLINNKLSFLCYLQCP